MLIRRSFSRVHIYKLKQVAAMVYSRQERSDDSRQLAFVAMT
jgi:hypothetical protein